MTRCWPYAGAMNEKGYGVAYVKGRMVLTHRAAYEALVGPVPAGLQLDHLCRNRACYNPAHLEPVTGSENTRRGNLARGTAITEHGAKMYRYYGCRCEVCTSGNTTVKREQRARGRN